MYIPQNPHNNPNPQHGDVQGPVAMQSNAGWYVGSVYYDAEFDFWGPNDRDTWYMESRQDAERFIKDYCEV